MRRWLTAISDHDTFLSNSQPPPLAFAHPLPLSLLNLKRGYKNAPKHTSLVLLKARLDLTVGLYSNCLVLGLPMNLKPLFTSIFGGEPLTLHHPTIMHTALITTLLGCNDYRHASL